MARATLSIVMPSFNQARFLKEAIGSVLSQRDRVKEFFVLDAGSTDGSREIIEKHGARADCPQTTTAHGHGSNLVAAEHADVSEAYILHIIITNAADTSTVT